MSHGLKMYDLAPSPNNIKVRLALGYKGLEFEKIPVNPQDRSELVRVSSQPLSPVLVHGDRVIFDSSAILRYLDANFRDTPPLFSADYGTMKGIEKWERFGCDDLVAPVGMVFGQFFAKEKDPAVAQKASEKVHEMTERIEERLAESDWLVGESMSAADVICASVVYLACLPEAAGAASPIYAFFRENLLLGADRERTRDWVGRVMAYDC